MNGPILKIPPFSNPAKASLYQDPGTFTIAEVSSSSSSSSQSTIPPPPPENPIVLGCGAAAADYLATVAGFPKVDDKIRSTNSGVEGGGNVGNALTCAARLGLRPRIISKMTFRS
ncbi:uncharacterized protein A4U43_C01F7730 [Asparagus officinalis]|uniref:Carbohydrate kinase PfkB domain-containing protein n=1 Tax=Asparagus officinalis TaxID=4686 RepID=A0A5P1FS91_ASPOF|nr:uncharacterized protein A4U43_C01F7730 [Asparagus officinalis]